jgi:hypothetical protein
VFINIHRHICPECHVQPVLCSQRIVMRSHQLHLSLCQNADHVEGQSVLRFIQKKMPHHMWRRSAWSLQVSCCIYCCHHEVRELKIAHGTNGIGSIIKHQFSVVFWKLCWWSWFLNHQDTGRQSFVTSFWCCRIMGLVWNLMVNIRWFLFEELASSGWLIFWKVCPLQIFEQNDYA